jgi:hypothetical protein
MEQDYTGLIISPVFIIRRSPISAFIDSDYTIHTHSLSSFSNSFFKGLLYIPNDMTY